MQALFASYLAVLACVLYGWVLNLSELITGYPGMGTNEFFLRLIGVPIAFVGALIGYLA